jgi:DNA-binding CsgD family transcriptional regulator
VARLTVCIGGTAAEAHPPINRLTTIRCLCWPGRDRRGSPRSLPQTNGRGCAGRRPQPRGELGCPWGQRLPSLPHCEIIHGQPETQPRMLWIEQLLPDAADAEGAYRALLALSEGSHHFGSWAWDLTLDRGVWSPRMARVFGLELGGAGDSAFLLSRIHPEDRERAAARLATRLNSPPSPSPSPPSGGDDLTDLHVRILRPDGDVRRVRMIVGDTIVSNGHQILIGITSDYTELYNARREVAAHVAVSTALDEWEQTGDGALRLLERLSAALGCGRSLLWTIQDERLVPKLLWTQEGDDAVWGQVRDLRLRRGQGLAGQAWLLGHPVGLDLPGTHSEYEFRQSAKENNFLGALALPALAEDEVLAVLSLASSEPFQVADRLRAALRALSIEIGQFLARRSAMLAGSPLSAREIEILQLAAHGHTGPDIAGMLFISPATVKSHFEHIYPKLEVTDRAAAVAQALRSGLIR